MGLNPILFDDRELWDCGLNWLVSYQAPRREKRRLRLVLARQIKIWTDRAPFQKCTFRLSDLNGLPLRGERQLPLCDPVPYKRQILPCSLIRVIPFTLRIRLLQPLQTLAILNLPQLLNLGLFFKIEIRVFLTQRDRNPLQPLF